jgi:hypothetical protein
MTTIYKFEVMSDLTHAEFYLSRLVGSLKKSVVIVEAVAAVVIKIVHQ